MSNLFGFVSEFVASMFKGIVSFVIFFTVMWLLFIVAVLLLCLFSFGIFIRCYHQNKFVWELKEWRKSWSDLQSHDKM